MLTVQDKKVLLALEDTGDIQELIEKTQLPEVAIMRSALTLQDNNLAEIHERTESIIELTKEGESLSQKLPERKILDLLKEPDTLNVKDAPISPSEATIALGWLKKKGLVDILKKDDSLILKITEEGKEFQEKRLPEEDALAKIQSRTGDTLSPEILKTLKSRKAITIKEKIHREIGIIGG